VRILFVLLAAHAIGDYVLQPAAIFQWKRTVLPILLLHAAIWSAVIALALVYLQRFGWWKLIISFVLHGLIDYWKSYLNPVPIAMHIVVIDQMLHMLQLILVGIEDDDIKM